MCTYWVREREKRGTGVKKTESVFKIFKPHRLKIQIHNSYWS